MVFDELCHGRLQQTLGLGIIYGNTMIILGSFVLLVCLNREFPSLLMQQENFAFVYKISTMITMYET